MFTAAVIPSADPLPLPAPPWLLWALLMLTWVLHVVAMNFVLGGAIIAAVSRVRGDEYGRRMAAWIGKLAPSIVAAAITFGVAPLLFVQALYGRLFFSSSVLMAWIWFAVVPILIVAYYGSYYLATRSGERGTVTTVIGGAVALLFLTISFIYSNNMSLTLRPQVFLAKYLQDARGFQLNLGDPTLLPRWLHMVLGAIAVAGAMVSIYGLTQRRRDDAYGSWLIRTGALWFVIVTAVNMVIGAWWAAVLPRPVLLRFMGGGTVATSWLVVAVVLGLIAWAFMVAALNSAAPEKLVARGAGALAGTLVFMAFARDEVREGMLELAGFKVVDRVQPQWDVIALFAILLIAALATTAWMVQLLLRPRGEESNASPIEPAVPVGGR